MNLSGVDRSSVLPYTSSIDAAYTILTKLQYQGWICNIRSKINDNGDLFYSVKISKNGLCVERFAPTVPLAICSTAISVLKAQYDKNIRDKSDGDSIQIAEKMAPTYLEIDDSKIMAIIKSSLPNLDSSLFDADGIATNIIDKLHAESFIIISNKNEI
jgi:hypothetical protein